MASENSPRGKRQILLACAAVIGLMLVAALALRMVGGAHGLNSPSSSAATGNH